MDLEVVGLKSVKILFVDRGNNLQFLSGLVRMTIIIYFFTIINISSVMWSSSRPAPPRSSDTNPVTIAGSKPEVPLTNKLI